MFGRPNRENSTCDTVCVCPGQTLHSFSNYRVYEASCQQQGKQEVRHEILFCGQMVMVLKNQTEIVAMKSFHILGIEFIRTVDIFDYAKESSEPHYYHLH